MSESVRNKQKHLTQENRVTIETELNAGMSMRSIAKETGKDPSTILKSANKKSSTF